MRFPTEELKPISKKSSYSKVVMKVHKTHFYPISAVFYDKGIKKVKEGKSIYKKNRKLLECSRNDND